MTVFIMCGQACLAQWRLVVRTKTNNRTYFSLAKNPKVEFGRTTININYDDYYSFSLDNIDCLFYDNGTYSSVETLCDTDISVIEKDGMLILNGLKNGTPVKVYNTSGISISSGRAEEGRPYILPLHTLQKGVYIIQSNNQSLKFQKL